MSRWYLRMFWRQGPGAFLHLQGIELESTSCLSVPGTPSESLALGKDQWLQCLDRELSLSPETFSGFGNRT